MARDEYDHLRADADAEHARVHVFGEATSADGGRTWQCRLCDGDILPPPPLMLGDVIRSTERADADRREYARRDPKRWS
jgi:hypothetical protein